MNRCDTALERVQCAVSRAALATLWDELYPQGLFTDDVTAAAHVRLAELDRPRCRMCVRLARWLETQQRYAAYCAGASCSNRDRLCQNPVCGQAFAMNVDGAGSKYCSIECKKIGYHPTSNARTSPGCAWCNKPGYQIRKGRWALYLQGMS